jgi:signal transduction histidine kinase
MTRSARRALVITLVTVLAGGGFLALQAAAGGLAAGAVVTLLFLPLHATIEALVERISGGQTTTAYHVLADLTTLSRAASADATNLASLAEAIAARVDARSCRLTVIHPGLQDRVYAWPVGNTAAGDDVVLPIRQGAEQIGTLAVDRAAGIRAQRRQQLADIANSLGAIVAVSRLGIELERQLRAAQAHAEEIAVSRRAAVAEMDNERRRMERNLHDGAQHHLVSLRMTLGLVEHGFTSGQLGVARDGLAMLTAQIDNAEAVLAETATGVSTVLLTERGLIAALKAELSGASPPIAVTSPEALTGRRFPPEIEAAVYFCCLEAVGNARKHAPGAAVRMQLEEIGDVLHFSVRDDGPGFTPQPSAASPGGRGLRNVTARIAAVGGTISIQSAPGAGTTVEGAVPVPGQPGLLVQVRELVRQARQLYDGSVESERLQALQAQLDRPSPVASTALQARSILQALDSLVCSAPRGGDRLTQLRYQLERIRSETHELSEIDLLDELRSGAVPFTSEERQAAEELLGAAGVEPSARLGLRADADAAQLRQVAAQQLARWRVRASHPASPRAVRNAAEVLVQTCEQLLTRASR